MSAGPLSLLLVPAVLLAWTALAYNRLVGLRNALRNAFAQIDVQLARRHDLVPGLVAVARAHLAHERATLEAVVAAHRGAAAARVPNPPRGPDPRAVERLEVAERALSGAVGSLRVLVEAHPGLEADRSLGRLTEELASTEDRIAFARRLYNAAVEEYNVGVERFPDRLVAGALAFHPASPLHSTRCAAEGEPVAVTA